MFPALLGAMALGMGGGVVSGMMGRSNAKQQQTATNHQYQHRYQWTMDDLKAAGLNPMLAMNSGTVGGGGSMATAPTPDLAGPMVNSFTAGTAKSLAVAQEKNLAAQTKASETQAVKNEADAIYTHQQGLNSALEAERNQMENEALRKNPNAIFNAKYQGNVAREIQNVFDLTRNSATSFMRGTGSFIDDLKTLGSATANDLKEYKKRVQDNIGKN